jgi:hypothetical protein
MSKHERAFVFAAFPDLTTPPERAN